MGALCKYNTQPGIDQYRSPLRIMLNEGAEYSQYGLLGQAPSSSYWPLEDPGHRLVYEVIIPFFHENTFSQF